MAMSLGGRVQDVSIETDGKGRRFGEITLAGSRGELIGALRELAEETEHFLARSSGSAHGSRNSDMRDFYDDLCVEEGAPVYLSDGVYLGADGHLFELRGWEDGLLHSSFNATLKPCLDLLTSP